MTFSVARRNMVDSQIRTNRVTDPLLLDALGAVPREEFVPKAIRGIAYVDDDLDIGAGRCLMEPMVLARLLQLAEINPSDVVLDVGCATGYSSGVLAGIAATVLALESDPDLSEEAAAVLAAQGVDNVAVVTGPLDEGYPAQAPYDVIVFQGAIGAVPERIRAQLADGGRLVAVVQDGPIGRATLITRTGDAFGRRVAFDASVSPLPGFVPKAGFVFLS
ncbi:MAG: protein-L-isoaspartate O-methyltransferase [Alphaproteobacteria bacterium]|nr:protein-L-isoaspartate O-methyltransferase [Alphaproteobacteria bacterium]